MDIKQIAFLEKELKLFGMAYVKNGEFVPNALHSSSLTQGTNNREAEKRTITGFVKEPTKIKKVARIGDFL